MSKMKFEQWLAILLVCITSVFGYVGNDLVSVLFPLAVVAVLWAL